jgi:integrase/recombinase XerD
MSRLDQLFQQFRLERTYLKNVTPKTIIWYESAWKAFGATHRQGASDSPLVSRSDLQHFVVSLRGRGVKPMTCNTWLRALNAFCRWLHEEGELPALVKLAPQRLEKRLLCTHDEAALRSILRFRPKHFSQWRVHALVSTILDTGCRIDELLTARVSDFSLDNLLLTVVGKGRKERRVPFSTELRKVLFGESGLSEGGLFRRL